MSHDNLRALAEYRSDSDRIGTHWAGCWRHHDACRAWLLGRVVLAQRDKLDHLDTAGEPFDRKWADRLAALEARLDALDAEAGE